VTEAYVTTSSAVTSPVTFPRRRMHHIFARDGRTVIVAMDAGIKRVAPGLENVHAAVAQVVDGGANAILATYGMARAVADQLGGAGLIIALDSEISPAAYGVEQAVRFGADALELKVFPGNKEESKLGQLRELAAGADRWGMPLMAEPIPVSFTDVAAHTLENVANGARISAEAGADFVKAQFVGTSEEYRSVIEGCFVPVLALGGPMKPTPFDALLMAEHAIAAGAKGVVFGRNVVEHPRPDRMVAALVAIVHGGVSAEIAHKELTVPL
jgi:DhnA family fructose-bisphosphate aldolase class Ia